MAHEESYEMTDRQRAFLDTIESPKYDRQIINGLKPFFEEKAPEDIRNFYSADELESLKVLHDTERDVETRMPVKVDPPLF